MGRPPKNKPTPTPEKKVKADTIEKEVPKEVVDDFFNHVIAQSTPEEPEIKTELLESEAEKPEILETQPESKPVDKIFEKYQEKVNEVSDINELLPYIYETALLCETCTEFGVRRPTSTYAFLAAKPKRLVSYDLGRYEEEVTEVEQLCTESGQDFQFILGNVLEIEIEETDFLFIDTFHTFTQLTKELQLHAGKAKKFIGFHDTETFGQNGQQWMPGVADHMNCGRGIYPAIENFLRDNPEWTLYKKLDFNNGLTILKKQ